MEVRPNAALNVLGRHGGKPFPKEIGHACGMVRERGIVTARALERDPHPLFRHAHSVRPQVLRQ